ncbi:cobalt-precorrin 5A hydrolase [Mangrovibacterium lignilyticum]|uniref:cobalt-precorrin 5A hydrolase n=1 Tax=Mangrovibacterium lignilyticum TaxID=2668052 RepID=UPI0013D86504|nr:cobalt-precorrin 5A hydrolase [Mangrovibacterium lignilyticum]
MKQSVAIISISLQGNQLAREIKQHFPEADCFTLAKWKAEGFRPIEGKLSQLCQQLFLNYDSLIFIMAAGIVVRSIAPWIQDKTSDPAVVVLDDAGKHAISLLSGHLGGANALTNRLANLIGANPVITTASDVNQLPSVDLLAQQGGLVISSMEDAKVVTASLVNRQAVELCDPDNWLGAVELPKISDKPAARIIVSNRTTVPADLPAVQLIPRNIYLGIGCKKDSSPEELWAFIEQQLEQLQLDKRSVAAVCSIGLKSSEPAILEAAMKLNCDTKFYEAQVLQTVEHLFEGSDFVKKITGVRSVSSPTAYLAGGKEGSFLLQKARQTGMTLSVFETKQHQCKEK